MQIRKTVPAQEWASFFLTELDPTPLILILRGLGPEQAVATAQQAWKSGVHLVEVTLETRAGVSALQAVVDAAPQGRPVGAGTVTTPAQLKAAADVGAAFGVAPGLDGGIVNVAADMGIPFLPGVATPSEVGRAVDLGLSIVKVFPASHLGPQWLRAIREPFPNMNYIPTGGINAETAKSYLDAGAIGVGVGSSITRGDELDSFLRIL